MANACYPFIQSRIQHEFIPKNRQRNYLMNKRNMSMRKNLSVRTVWQIRRISDYHRQRPLLFNKHLNLQRFIRQHQQINNWKKHFQRKIRIHLNDRINYNRFLENRTLILSQVLILISNHFSTITTRFSPMNENLFFLYSFVFFSLSLFKINEKDKKRSYEIIKWCRKV